MKSVGIGIIGCGGRMEMLLDDIFKKGRPLHLTALFDPRRERCERFKAKFNAPDAKICDSYMQVARDPNADWVMVASWNCFHQEHVVASLMSGKNVFCEKPLAITIEQCAAMKQAVVKSGKKFMLGFTLRYSPHYAKIKQLIDRGEIGQIISMEFNETLEFFHGGYIHSDWRRLRENAGSHILEKCCHDIDLVNWISGSVPLRAASFGGLDFFLPKNAYLVKKLGRDDNGRWAYMNWAGSSGMDPFNADKNIIDNQVIILEYANGIRSTFHSNCNAGIAERRMYICGARGSIRADVLTGTIELKRIGYKEKIRIESTPASGIHGCGDPVLIEHLLDLMFTRARPMTSIDDGIKSAVAAFGIDAALDSGTVVDLRPMWKKAKVNLKEFAKKK
jgi:predicted dehydrogenase